jgi:competence protein ComEA
VVGKVRRPGIAVLPPGARVVDAVEAAGGVRRGVDPATVNMARLLSDGEQVVVGGPPGSPAGPPAPTSGPAAGGGLVNLNTADQAALETLPGVGPVTAAAILEWRAEHGAFTAVEELLEVSGIGDATLAEIAPHVTL